jgi:cytochrome P450
MLVPAKPPQGVHKRRGQLKVIDMKAPEAIRDRATFYNTLRDDCPVAKIEAAEQEHYLLMGYENVRTLLNDHERFSKHWGNQMVRMENGIALNQDPPDFNAFRSLYTGYMSPRGVKRWANDCSRIANDLVDSMIQLGSGDLQQLIGKPLPARVAAIALGFPEDRVEDYRRWTDMFLTSMIEDPEAQKRVIDEMYVFFAEQIEKCRQMLRSAGITEPQPEHVGTVLPDTLTSVLLTHKYQGEYLSDAMLQRTIRGFFVGAVDTTGALVLNLLYRLLEQPELMQQVRENPKLLDAAMEESLRFDPPAIGMFRETTEACPVGGETIPAQARVLYSTFSANRDPSVYSDPDTFRLDRRPSQTPTPLSFGGGAHFCPGAWTARMEAKIALEIIIERLPNLRLTGPVEHFEAINFFVVRSFPAAWD